MFSTILSAAVLGIEAYPVQVEADICDGLPQFCMVGDLSPEVREAADRVRTALRNTGISFPPRRVTVNLSPANLRKEGTRFDLPVAAALLTALGVLPQECSEDSMIVGEVGLNGAVRPVPGILQTVLLASERGVRRCLIPADNIGEGQAVAGMEVWGIHSVEELIDCLLKNKAPAVNLSKSRIPITQNKQFSEDFREINGQEAVRRAAEIAAAGMHNFLMVGSPGAGKTMIARRIPTILPSLSLEESLEVSRVYSACGLLTGEQGLVGVRPFRAPHHTVSVSALAGGGRHILPGELSLATRGVLFLDELPEFHRNVLETLRQPMEDGVITISRADGKYTFPAHFQLVAAMNPCKCGFYPDRTRCNCLPGDISRYLKRISGPLLDRIDICTEISPVEYGELTGKRENESSEAIRSRVLAAHRRQQERYKKVGIQFNSQLTTRVIQNLCPLGTEETGIMEQAFESLRLSARGYYRIIRVARTIADLEGSKEIRTPHLLEAVGYRTMDHNIWEKPFG